MGGSAVKRLLWASQDIIDAGLDRLSNASRWAIVGFLIDHRLLNACIVEAYFWAEGRGESIFELPGQIRAKGCLKWGGKR